MNDVEMLAQMGTDAQKWAQEWCRIADEISIGKDKRTLMDEGWMIGWFANAIEAGRMAGRERATQSLKTAAHMLIAAWNQGENLGGEHDLDQLNSLIRQLDDALFVEQTQDPT
jgi:hypothetical protein